MKKSELKQILEAIQKVREILTPEQAAQVPYLFPDVNKEGQAIEKGKTYRDGNELFEAQEDITPEEKKQHKPSIRTSNNQKWKKKNPKSQNQFHDKKVNDHGKQNN